jgi:hypothetical protein
MEEAALATGHLLDILAYERSANFLQAGNPAMMNAPAYGHVFRRATAEPRLIGEIGDAGNSVTNAENP